MSTGSHQITSAPTTDGNTRWACTCGWVTIEYAGAPSHHTPIAERIAEHLAKEDAIATGRVWSEIAPHACEFQLDMRTTLDGQRHDVITAVWMGGFREVAVWDHTTADELIASIDLMMRWQHMDRVVWADSGATVEADELRKAYAA